MSKSTLTVAALIFLSCAGSSLAQSIEGHWEAGLGTDGTGLGLIVPEYSPNEFVVLSLECDRAKRTVTVVHDTGLDTRPTSVVIPLLVDGKAFPIRGRPWRSEVTGFWYVDGIVPYGSPVGAALSQARTLGVDGHPRTRKLPTSRFTTAHANWLRRCGIR